MSQQTLFSVPVDERRINDVGSTLLEAIDRAGPISANEAGRIVYRLRGYRHVSFVPRAWVTSAGGQALQKLEQAGLLRRTRGSRWTRSAGSEALCPDLIGLRKQTFSSTLTTLKVTKRWFARVTSRFAHAHDTSANRRFLGVSGPVTSSDLSSAASRSAVFSGSRRTAPPRRRVRLVL